MSKIRTTRSRRTKAQWQVLIENYNANPIDPQTYCKQVGITFNRFRIWQQRFPRADFVEVQPTLAPKASRVPRLDSSAASKHWDIELSLGQDIILRMRQH